MKYSEMYTDADGETHFRDVEVEFSLVDVAPPAAPMNISDFRPAPGWDGGWHPAPSVGHVFVLQGEMEVEVSDGEIRRFPQGSIWLHRDLTGKGHDSRVVSEDAAVLVMVKMNESQ
jgi:quercetin dioxygenase-like cupin family protein